MVNERLGGYHSAKILLKSINYQDIMMSYGNNHDLIAKHKNLDAVTLGCTEFPMVVNADNSVLPIIDPVCLQAIEAVNYSLGDGL